MVTGCGCHDPIVFGHQVCCRDGLGPREMGGRRGINALTMPDYQARYDPDRPAPKVTKRPTARAAMTKRLLVQHKRRMREMERDE